MKPRLISASLLALLLAACTNDNDPMTPADGEVAAQIVAEINHVATRASGTQWAANDRIGISTVSVTKTSYTNVPYTWNGTEFEDNGTIIYFQDTKPVTFNAYYPYAEKGGTVEAVTNANAQKDENQKNIDFLFAKGAKADKKNSVVYFTDKRKDNGEDNSFHHCMSMIAIEFSEGDDIAFSDKKLQSYTLKGLVLEGTFNTETGEAKTTDGKQAADLKTEYTDEVTVNSGVFTAAPVIVFPQTPQWAWEGASVEGKIGLEVMVEDETYHATLTIPGGITALEAGCRYTFPVTVKKTGLSVGTAEITDWEPVTGSGTEATM